MAARHTNRRQFLGALGGTLAANRLGSRLLAGELPTVTNPRATDGDERFEPDWEKRLTITVGPDKADLVGGNNEVRNSGEIVLADNKIEGFSNAVLDQRKAT